MSCKELRPNGDCAYSEYADDPSARQCCIKCLVDGKKLHCKICPANDKNVGCCAHCTCDGCTCGRVGKEWGFPCEVVRKATKDKLLWFTLVGYYKSTVHEIK